MNWPSFYSGVGSLPCPQQPSQSVGSVTSPARRHKGCPFLRLQSTYSPALQFPSQHATPDSAEGQPWEAKLPMLEEEPLAAVPCPQSAGTREQRCVHAPWGLLLGAAPTPNCDEAESKFSVLFPQLPQDTSEHVWEARGLSAAQDQEQGAKKRSSLSRLCCIVIQEPYRP